MTRASRPSPHSERLGQLYMVFFSFNRHSYMREKLEDRAVENNDDEENDIQQEDTQHGTR